MIEMSIKINKMKEQLFTYKRTIPLDIYKEEITVILSNDTDKLNKKFDLVETEYFAMVTTSGGRGLDIVIILNPLHSQCKLAVGTVAHESFHAAMHLAYHKGIDVEFSNQEPMAYLLEYITNKVHKFLQDKQFDIN